MPRRGVGVSGVPVDEIRRSLIHYVSEREFELSDSDRRTLDFDRPASKWTAMRYGSFVSPETFVRMKVFIMEVGPNDYWVGFEPTVVTERGTGFERRQPLKGAVTSEMQTLLQNWKAQLQRS